MRALAAGGRLTRYGVIALIFILALLAWLIALKIVGSLRYADSDFFSFWLAGRFALTGQDPYASAAWIAGHRLYGANWVSDPIFIYPLPLALFFVPLALLPVFQAYVLWVALSVLMTLASGALLLRLHPRDRAAYYILPLAAGAFLFRPTILTLLNGQLTALLLLLLACVVYLWGKERWWQGGLLLPMLALKPNLGVPILAMLSLYLLLRRRFSALVSEAVSGVILLLIGFAQNPDWIGEYAGIGGAKVGLNYGLAPTIWGVSEYLCGYNAGCALPPAATIALLLLAGYAVFLVKKRQAISPAWAAGLSVTITLLVTPYTWQYDQMLLLIPIVEVAMGLAGTGLPFLVNALIPLGIDVLAFLLLWISGITGVGIWSALIPVCVLALAGWVLAREWANTSPRVRST